MRKLYGLNYRRAGTGSVRASSNLLVRLAARDRLPADNDLQVAVLGAIGATKGGLFLQVLATDAQDRKLPLRFSIVSFSDPALTGGLDRAGVTETRRYSTEDPTLDRPARAGLQIAETGGHWEDDETVDLLIGISADLVLIPATWPETYSSVLTLAMRTGLPVATFDLGAPGDRLRAHSNGHLLPYALAGDPAASNDRLLAIDTASSGRLNGPIQAAEYESPKRDYDASGNLDRMCSLREITSAGNREAFFGG